MLDQGLGLTGQCGVNKNFVRVLWIHRVGVLLRFKPGNQRSFQARNIHILPAKRGNDFVQAPGLW